jgi:hypothetical protein
VGSGSIVSLVGWSGNGTLSLAAFPTETPSWSISIAGAEPDLISTSAIASIVPTAPQLGPSLSNQLSQLVGGGAPAVMWSQPTADGVGDIYAVRSAAGTAPPLIIALYYQSSATVVQLPVSPQSTLDGWLVDALAQTS